MRRKHFTARPRSQNGFSLLEMVVAIAILAMALGALYQAASGATRNVRSDERYTYAVELARSLLALNGKVPISGLSSNGEVGKDFRWQVQARPLNFRRTRIEQGTLQEIEVRVDWLEGVKRRQVVLNSVVEGVQP
jgi:general secretion pathway protein I